MHEDVTVRQWVGPGLDDDFRDFLGDAFIGADHPDAREVLVRTVSGSIVIRPGWAAALYPGRGYVVMTPEAFAIQCERV